MAWKTSSAVTFAEVFLEASSMSSRGNWIEAEATINANKSIKMAKINGLSLKNVLNAFVVGTWI